MNFYLEEINFSPTLKIWKTNFDKNKLDSLQHLCKDIIEKNPQNKHDGYPTFFDKSIKTNKHIDLEINNELDYLRNFVSNICVDLYAKPFTNIFLENWINVVRAKSPVQKNYDENNELIFHNHAEMNYNDEKRIPNYTFICYIQMPDNLENKDGVLFLKDVDKKVYSILPKDGDIIILKGDLPHVPNYALNSTKDRIVLAGNIGFWLRKIEKSII